MTDDEITKLLLILSESYRVELSDVEIDVWSAAVHALDFDIAGVAAVTVIKSSEYMPAVSKFLDAYNGERRARAVKVPSLPPTRPGVTDEGRRLIAEARANLTRKGRAS